MLFWPLYLSHYWIPPRVWLCLLAAFGLYSILLYVLRKSATLTLPWSEVRQIIFDEDKRRAGIVYNASDKAGEIKTYFLVFALNAALYPSFVRAAEQYAPGLGITDKLRRESMVPLLVIVSNGVVIMLVALLAYRLFIGHH